VIVLVLGAVHYLLMVDNARPTIRADPVSPPLEGTTTL